jgi:type IV pilus assembly protein PilF
MSEDCTLRTKRIVVVLLLGALLQACVSAESQQQQTQNEKASAVNVQLGIGYLQQNNLEVASEKLTKALRQDPNSPAANNAYAILQDRLGQKELAEQHYLKATELDPKDAGAANNYGRFLCMNGRELESEKYFKRALDNPLYSTPEVAYTNAAICLLRVQEVEQAKKYLLMALTEKSDFSTALIALGGLYFDLGDYADAQVYLDRFHLVAKATPRSLWLSIRTALALDPQADISGLVKRLGTDFPDSREYDLWKAFE